MLTPFRKLKKGKKKLKWRPTINIKNLISEMIESEYKNFNEN